MNLTPVGGTCKIALLDLRALLKHCQTTQHEVPNKVNGLKPLSNPEREDFVALLNSVPENSEEKSPEPSRPARLEFRCNLCISPRTITSVPRAFRHLDQWHSCVTCLSCMRSFHIFKDFRLIQRSSITTRFLVFQNDGRMAASVRPARMAKLAEDVDSSCLSVALMRRGLRHNESRDQRL